MLRFFPLLVVMCFSQLATASVFGNLVRGADVAESYPSKITVTRFSGAQVDDMQCEWKNAGGYDLTTDRGNTHLNSFPLAPNVIEIYCDGKKPFMIFNLSEKYLSADAQEGDVGIWFGGTKDRYGCEGYNGCDKVHVLELYRNAQAGPEDGLQAW